MPLPLTYLPDSLHTYSLTPTYRECTAPNYVGLTFGEGTRINQVDFFICNWAYTYWPTAQLQYKHIAFRNLSLSTQCAGRWIYVCVYAVECALLKWPEEIILLLRFVIFIYLSARCEYCSNCYKKNQFTRILSQRRFRFLVTNFIKEG